MTKKKVTPPSAPKLPEKKAKKPVAPKVAPKTPAKPVSEPAPELHDKAWRIRTGLQEA
jgi:hypothetical protein